ncbi:PCYCGC motif-containing (lipo)protein [Hydrogenophaga sp.]|jgi:hypothetical protein|uniref:PCYCGC motif-containing (lipo)protein n=1 Tax=Hydrogenophaga sp. TaxID=1904254 RepID=UPI002604E2E7|nr:PCYCGC motif-containing (lipo)protein [Hydrogenophaga sp.]
MKRQAKSSRTRAAQPAARSKRRQFPTTAVITGLALMGVALIAIWLIPVQEVARIEAPAKPAQASGIPTWTVGMLRPDGLRIVVTGSNDASKVLDPQRFSRSEVRHGYWVATQIPEVLNKLYCWCGCENRGFHRSNLQCFEDEMAKDCPVCLGTAEIAYDMTQKGITDAAKIQAAVDVHWGPNR